DHRRGGRERLDGVGGAPRQHPEQELHRDRRRRRQGVGRHALFHPSVRPAGAVTAGPRSHPLPQEVVPMYSLALLTALALPAAAPAAPGGMAPEQALAVIDAKGKMIITHVSCTCYGPAVQENVVTVPGEKDTKVKVKVSSVMLTTAEIDAKHVQAYTVAGKTIPVQKL